MMIIPVIAFLETFFKVTLGLTSLFLIMLVLVQRGRGGGLAGALGGMGGSSAFGAKAGDVFTKVTVVSATFWILLCIAADRFGPTTATRIRTGTPVAPATGTVPGSAEVPAVGGLTEDGEPVADDAPPADAAPAETQPAETPPADEGAVGDAAAESPAPLD